ncbi:MAG: GAF domain-containing sensor histidine kinase [Thermoleophilia bacterium]|nr:GAF domain-containing sensor histidine kinase [Thermoleophilia bacterium]MDH4339242.1 GAF domain-containing sensor histidine kinase [Thermoleophilia bacterium]MDH5280199.1 GAF domain-containing sensor histidine kinase [Thermoleophilia bacterium]
MTLGQLKWLAIIVPIALLSGFWALLHSVFFELHEFPDVLFILGGTVAGTALFAFAVFAVVNRLEQRILVQNKELEQRTQELETLLTVGRAASSSLELGELLDAAMDAILEATKTDAAEVWLRSTPGELVLTRHRGADEDAFTERTRLRDGEGLPGLTAAQAATIVVHDLPNESRFVRPLIVERGFQTYCGLPLRHRDEIVGVLGVASKEPGRLSSDRDLRLLAGIGEAVALAIANARLHERVLDGAVLEERIRIARELHDGLAQVLGYINTQTLAVKRLLATGRAREARDELDAMERAARNVYGDVREAILGLRMSLPRQGLIPALRRYLEEYSPMSGVTLKLDAGEHAETLKLQPEVEIQLMRVVQEALANVRKHAHAAHATVRITVDDGILAIEVADDGQGFDPGLEARTGWPRFGLQTMRERVQAVGGRFEIESKPGAGTRLKVTLPAAPEEVALASGAR